MVQHLTVRTISQEFHGAQFWSPIDPDMSTKNWHPNLCNVVDILSCCTMSSDSDYNQMPMQYKTGLICFLTHPSTSSG